MVNETAIRDSIANYWKTFSAGDRAAWLELFAEDATVEDPIGTPVHQGREAISAFFDASQGMADSIELSSLDITNVCGNEAAFAMRIRPTIGGTTFEMVAIDVMTFDDGARITTMRAYWQPETMHPAE